MEGIIFEFYRGDTYTRDFCISGYKSSIDNVYFTVKESEQNKFAVISKKLNEGITVVDKDEDSTTYNLLIKCTDTNDLKVNFPYVFDVEIITNTADGDIRKTIMKGTITLKANVTQPCNEF